MEPKIILFGAGEIGEKWLKHLGREKVYCFVDTDKRKIGTALDGIKIQSVDFLIGMEEEYCLFLSVNKKHFSEIEKLLEEKGLKEKIVKSPYWENGNFIHYSARMTNVWMEGQNYVGQDVELNNCKLGYGTYVADYAALANVTIGRFSAIGPKCGVIIGQHPTSRFAAIHPAFYSVDNAIGYSYVKETKFEEMRFAEGEHSVVIGHDVWIGKGAQIMEGVTIADGSIIAAGAVVTHDTMPYSINAGVPAKPIKYRFAQNIINKLCEIQWWNRDVDWIRNHADLFENVEELLQYIEKEAGK